MALWKPFRGSRTALDTQSLHDGYAYFCTDDGSLHFDYVDAEGTLRRKQISAEDAETLCGMSLEEIKKSISWNDLLDRPFGTTTDTTRTTVYEGLCIYTIDYEIGDIEDKNVIVTVDGMEYEGACTFDTSVGAYRIVSNGETIAHQNVTDSATTISGSDGSTQRSVKIEVLEEVEVVNTLDEKYIPDTVARVSDIPEQIQSDWSVNDESAVDYIKNRPFYTTDPEAIELHNGTITFQEAAQGDTIFYIGQAEQLNEYSDFTVGQEIKIIFDEVEYNLTLKLCDIGLYAGNASIINDMYGLSEEDTGEPFYYIPGRGFITTTSETEHTIVAYVYHIEDITIPHKYLGLNIWNGGGNKSAVIGNETNVASGVSSVALGEGTTASGDNSHAEGYSTTASGYASHAEGHTTTASGSGAHAEGSKTTASNARAHAEGSSTTASGMESHAEGQSTKAQAIASHAEGIKTTASGEYASHAEGYYANATASYAHAEGLYTVAASESQHAQGKFNIEDTTAKYAHIVGNGTNTANRSNAHTLDWDGNAWFAGNIKVGGTGQDDAETKTLATTEYVDIKTQLENLGIYIGPDEPTDANIKIWINTSEEGTGVTPLLPRIVTVTLVADAWEGSSNPWSQVVTVNGVSVNSKVDLQPTAHQIVALQNADIALMAENNNGVVTVYALGGKPTTDYTMQVLITEVAYV